MSGSGLSLRPVTAADRELLFTWANDPETRMRSFASDPISWPEHCAWFEARMRDTDELFWMILSAAGEPVGQLRVTPEADGMGVVSVSIAPAWRGRGLAAEGLALATRSALASGRFTGLRAYVRPDNEASLRAFARAGYRGARPVHHRGHDTQLLCFPPEAADESEPGG